MHIGSAAIALVALSILTPGCSPVATPEADGFAGIIARPQASPYTEVVRGRVSALVPRNWRTVLAPSVDGIRAGFFSSPHPRAWDRMDGSVAGMAATWIDATKVSVPSDFYYLAATGPLLDQLTDGACHALHRRIYANHRPGVDGARGPSQGDYVARSEGRCAGAGADADTRWASFVAAPGFGPAREVGIPGSGLYVVVAVLRDSAGAGARLHHLVRHAAFGGTTVPELVGSVTGRYPVPA